jgi:hypothetical protein
MKYIKIDDSDLFGLARSIEPGCSPVSWRVMGNMIQVVCQNDETEPKPKAKAKPKDAKPDEE